MERYNDIIMTSTLSFAAATALLHITINSASAADVEILPLNISLDRAFDVQWNPPGYPVLEAKNLTTPFGDHNSTDPGDGHYTFAKHEDGMMSFVRQKTDGAVCQVFEVVDFLVVGADVLMMNGDPNPWILGDGFGTLIKGMSIPAGDAPGNYTTTPIADSNITVEEWLLTNFEGSEDASTVVTTPIEACSAWYAEFNSSTFLGIPPVTIGTPYNEEGNITIPPVTIATPYNGEANITDVASDEEGKTTPSETTGSASASSPKSSAASLSQPASLLVIICAVAFFSFNSCS